MFGRKFGFRGPFMMEKIPHAIGNQILPLKCSFGIGYGIGRKYLPIWVWVSVSDLNQNSGFGLTDQPLFGGNIQTLICLLKSIKFDQTLAFQE